MLLGLVVLEDCAVEDDERSEDPETSLVDTNDEDLLLACRCGLGLCNRASAEGWRVRLTGDRGGRAAKALLWRSRDVAEGDRAGAVSFSPPPLQVEAGYWVGSSTLWVGPTTAFPTVMASLATS